VKEAYFSAVSSPATAYWLGFLYADGNIRLKPYWAVTINLASKDKQHLLDLQATIGGRVTDLTASTDHMLNGHVVKGGPRVRWVVYSRSMVLDLLKLGVAPSKSRHPVMPQVPKEFLRDFLRGLFDGDGCVYLGEDGRSPLVAFCGHPDVVAWVVQCIEACVGVKAGTIRHRNNTAYAQWSSWSNVSAVVLFLYKRHRPVLKRKFIIARRILSVHAQRIAGEN
jgi:hypothetical protein